MARDETPMFERGMTFYNGGAIDTNNYGGLGFEGQTRTFEDVQVDAAGGAKPQRSNRLVKCMCVQNISGINLLPKRLVTLQKSGLNYLGRVDGYVTTLADRCYPVDEYLPAAGVPNGDLFWIVIEGPAMVLTDLAPLTSLIAVGDLLTGQTAVTSQSTTAGRAVIIDMTGATALLANQIQNRVGRALSAKTTNNTNQSLLAEIGKW